MIAYIGSIFYIKCFSLTISTYFQSFMTHSIMIRGYLYFSSVCHCIRRYIYLICTSSPNAYFGIKIRLPRNSYKLVTVAETGITKELLPFAAASVFEDVLSPALLDLLPQSVKKSDKEY